LCDSIFLHSVRNKFTNDCKPISGRDKGADFVEKGVQAYEMMLKAGKEKQLNKLAAELNMVVTTAHN
jgi:hypothetical protein